MIVLFCLFTICCFAQINLVPDPQQGFNGTENFANRFVYFFIEYKNDGSVSLQVEPPPFYSAYDQVLRQGIAYIDMDPVVKTFTAKEVANLGDVDISFTIKAFANKQAQEGFNLYAQAYQWMFLLDPRSIHYYQLQQYNNASVTNPTIGGHTFYSDVVGVKHWVSNNSGVFLTKSDLDNVLLKVEKAATDGEYTLTIRLDFSQFTAPPQPSSSSNIPTAVPPPGIYSLYFFFQMTPIDLSEPLIDTINNFMLIQQTQFNYLYNNILWINGFLQGNNALYDPNTADQVIIRVNRQNLIDQYNEMLVQVSKQWDEFAAIPSLNAQEQAAVTSMQTYLSQAQANTANFTI